jgi:hypothetical protein
MSFKTKSVAQQDFLNDTARTMFGRSVDEAYQQGVCVLCGQSVTLADYADIDIAEYNISGIGTCCFPSGEDE